MVPEPLRRGALRDGKFGMTKRGEGWVFRGRVGRGLRVDSRLRGNGERMERGCITRGRSILRQAQDERVEDPPLNRPAVGSLHDGKFGMTKRGDPNPTLSQDGRG